MGLVGASSAVIGPYQSYVYPDDADTMGDNITSPKPSHLPGGMQADLLGLLKNYRDDHGGCKDLEWDDALVNDMYNIAVNPDPAVKRCNDVNTDITGQFITSISYHMTSSLDTANRPQPSTTEVWNDFLTRHADSIQILKWQSASKIGCAYCEQTQWNKAYIYQLYCKITETLPSATNTVAANVLASGSRCSACDGVTCPDQKCKLPGAQCDIQAGGCKYVNAQFGTTCDDNSAATKDDICDGFGVCSGTPLCQGVVCAAGNDCEEQGTCDTATGGCVKVLKPDGTMCDDNNANTKDDKCAMGVCKGLDRCAGVTCTAQSDCHEVGVCNPSTGDCSNPVKPVGTMCSDGNTGTVFDVCNDMGACVGQDLCAGVVCQMSQCISGGTCSPQTGLCVYTNQPSGTACDDGISYTDNDRCDSGVCKGTDNGCGQISCDLPIQGPDACRASGVCNGGACEWMYLAVGSPCVDGDADTVNDMCVDSGNGVVKCQGVNKCIGVTCDADQCNEVGTCNPQDGTCVHTAKADGTTCDDGIATTFKDKCEMGVCRGTDLCIGVDCSGTAVVGTCKEGVCDQATGMCVSKDAPDGFGCDDSDATTSNDVCMAGVCKGTDRCASVTCNNPMAGQCEESTGRCDPTTGQCAFSINKVDGTPCDDGDASTMGDRCKAGVCVSGANCDVEIIDHYSKTKCELGKTYGFTPDGSFFVDAGCRAKVRIVANDHIIKCESWGWKYKECPIFPRLPSCSTQTPEPCPSSTNCPGFTKLGEGRCVDKTDARFDSFILHNKDKAHCMAVAGSTKDIAGVEYNPTTMDCVLLATNDQVLAGIKWDASELTHLGQAPVAKSNNDPDWMCWTPEDRCVGVVCQAADDCHEAGVCQPQTGKCTSPPKGDGSFCDDNNPASWNDQCSNGVCQGQTGPKECWIPSSFWAGHKKCKKLDASRCAAYGSGCYQTEAKCCSKEFGGCSNSQTDSCWVAGKSWPEKNCRKASGRHCMLPIGNWKTETECCARGAAHVKGCAQKDNNDGVADKPEQCICDPNEFTGQVNEKTEVCVLCYLRYSF